MNKTLIKKDKKQNLIIKKIDGKRWKAVIYLIMRAISAKTLAIIIVTIGFYWKSVYHINDFLTFT